MIIEIRGVQFVNKGAELMLHAVLQQIEQRWPNAEVALRACPNSPYLKRAKLGAWQKLSLRKHIIEMNWLTYLLPDAVRNFAKRYGLVTEADIDLVLDASGFAYGDSWPSRQLTHVSKEITRLKSKGKPYIFLPQAFGPFDKSILKQSIATHWSDATLIFARDQTSFRYVARSLEEGGNAVNNLHQMPDFTNLVIGKQVNLNDANKVVLLIPNSKMVSKRNTRAAWRSDYIMLMAEMCKRAKLCGYSPMLLNHDGAEDAKLCDAIVQEAGFEIKVKYFEDPLEVKGLIGAVSAVISSRFHGCVSALSQGIPCIGTSWSHKYEELFAEYEQFDMLITSPNVEASMFKVDKLLSEKFSQECKANARIDELKNRSNSMWDMVERVVVNHYA